MATLSSILGASYTGATGATGATGTGADGPAGPVGPKAIVINTPGSSENVTLFYTTSALTISNVRTVLTGSSTPALTFSILSGSDRNTGATTHVSSYNSTNTTTGESATIANASISANRWVWLTSSATGGTVTSFSITLNFS
jgi:hypothetical protein